MIFNRLFQFNVVHFRKHQGHNREFTFGFSFSNLPVRSQIRATQSRLSLYKTGHCRTSPPNVNCEIDFQRSYILILPFGFVNFKEEEESF
jgi:hypothetical protein